MNIPRRSVYALLLFLIGINYLARYPRTPHELGFDAFVFHGMTLSLVNMGYAPWILHPLSYFGLYPLSHPGGSLFMVGALSLTSGATLEGAILAYDWVLVAAGVLLGYAMSMEVRRDSGLALLVAGLFSLSPRLVTSLLWELPTRTLFTIFLPMFVLTLLRLHRTRDPRWAGVAIAIVVIMMSAHRLTSLVTVLLLAFVLSTIILVAAQTLRTKYASRVLAPRFRRVANLVVIVTFFAISIGLLTYGGVLTSYETGRVGLGSGIVAQAANLVVSLARSAGFLVVMVPLGIIALYRTRMKGLREGFLLMTLLLLIPTLTLRQYTGYYIIPFTALFVGRGVWYIVQKAKRPGIQVAIVAAALAVSLASSQIVVAFDLQFEPYVDNESYSQGVYVLSQTQGTIVANDGLLGSKVFAISGHPYLPVGGATTAFQSPELLIFGFVEPNRLRIQQIPLGDLTLESDSPLVLLDVQAERDWATMLDHSRTAVSPQDWRTYNPAYLLENWDAQGGYFAYGKRYDSPFVESVHDTCYKVFEISGQTLWYVGGPA